MGLETSAMPKTGAMWKQLGLVESICWQDRRMIGAKLCKESEGVVPDRPERASSSGRVHTRDILLKVFEVWSGFEVEDLALAHFRLSILSKLKL
jgi:hypothetical protein